MSTLTYSIHAYAWTPRWSNETLNLIDRADAIGFDMIEIPLMELETIDPAAIRKKLDESSIGVCTSTACSEDADPTSEDEVIRNRACTYLKGCVKATADMGATVFTGVTYSAIGRKIPSMPGEEYWLRAATVLKETATYARDFGVIIGIEPINRYETFLVNTCEQAIRLMNMIDEPNVKIHLDAYHMNIEECDFYTPTLKAAPYLCHYHLSESHRGTVGTGLVDWEGIYRALSETGYKGTVGMESFIEPSPAMAAATCIWRRLADDTDTSLKDGLNFLRMLEAKYF
jgi:D-psicose/D-tagatose/L-ribulose 3-epimerase